MGKLWSRYLCWKHDPKHLLKPQVKAIKQAIGNRKNVQVVQIGSNDGVTNDPLHDLLMRRNSWKALFVEPVPYLLSKIAENYGNDDRFSFAQVAVSNRSGTLPFYSVSQEAKNLLPDLPFWYDEVASFDRNHISNCLGPEVDPFITELQVASLTLQDLLDRYSITSIDLLHIDTEGHDWKILSQLDLHQFRPKVILFEILHLAENEKQDAIAKLGPFYEITTIRGDFLCILR